MIKDYKGEMPSNVVAPEKAKAQKPFYKNWKFWFLTGLMTLFGACSIYGLVLGSQYVKAIERASHIIADAQGSESQKEAFKRDRQFAYPYNEDVAVIDLGSITWRYPNASGWSYGQISLPGAIVPAGGSSNVSVVCGGYTTGNPNYCYANDYTCSISVAGEPCIRDPRIIGFSGAEVQAFMAGKLFYYATDGSVGPASQTFYEEGYQEGYSDGYSDGSDAINVNQYFRVVMPVGNDSVQYETYIDGVLNDQGHIIGGSTSPNYREFTRNRNQVLRVDLTLPANYKAFWLYTPAFTSSFPTDDNVSLQESWAVDGVTYLPTWVGSVQLWVNVTGANVPDLTYQTISVAFDVAHWGDIKVGAYQQGYQQGYVDGQENPTAYQSGYDAGYEQGHDAGEIEGFNRGVGVGSSGSNSLAHMFRVAFQLPFDQLYAYLNFNLLGINFASLFTALITVSLGILVIKKVL